MSPDPDSEPFPDRADPEPRPADEPALDPDQLARLVGLGGTGNTYRGDWAAPMPYRDDPAGPYLARYQRPFGMSAVENLRRETAALGVSMTLGPDVIEIGSPVQLRLIGGDAPHARQHGAVFARLLARDWLDGHAPADLVAAWDEAGATLPEIERAPAAGGEGFRHWRGTIHGHDVWMATLPGPYRRGEYAALVLTRAPDGAMLAMPFVHIESNQERLCLRYEVHPVTDDGFGPLIARRLPLANPDRAADTPVGIAALIAETTAALETLGAVEAPAEPPPPPLPDSPALADPVVAAAPDPVLSDDQRANIVKAARTGNQYRGDWPWPAAPLSKELGYHLGRYQRPFNGAALRAVRELAAEYGVSLRLIGDSFFLGTPTQLRLIGGDAPPARLHYERFEATRLPGLMRLGNALDQAALMASWHSVDELAPADRVEREAKHFGVIARDIAGCHTHLMILPAPERRLENAAIALCSQPRPGGRPLEIAVMVYPVEHSDGAIYYRIAGARIDTAGDRVEKEYFDNRWIVSNPPRRMAETIGVNALWAEIDAFLSQHAPRLQPLAQAAVESNLMAGAAAKPAPRTIHATITVNPAPKQPEPALTEAAMIALVKAAYADNLFRGQWDSPKPFIPRGGGLHTATYQYPFSAKNLTAVRDEAKRHKVSVAVEGDVLRIGEPAQLLLVGGDAPRPRGQYNAFEYGHALGPFAADAWPEPAAIARAWAEAQPEREEDRVEAKDADFITLTREHLDFRIQFFTVPRAERRMESSLYGLARRTEQDGSRTEILFASYPMEASDRRIYPKIHAARVDTRANKRLDRSFENRWYRNHTSEAEVLNPPLEEFVTEVAGLLTQHFKPLPKITDGPLLDQYADRLGEAAAVVGRESEVASLAAVLLGQYANIAVIVGEPGAGKTALVEGLAARLKQDDEAWRVFAVDLAELTPVGSTSTVVRRVADIMEEAARQPRTVLFLRDMHGLMGRTGWHDGNGFHLIRTKGGRPDLKLCIELTAQQYDQLLKEYPEAVTVLQPVWLNELPKDRIHAVVSHATEELARRHGVAYPPAAIETAIALADKFQKKESQPLKSLKLLDSAGGLARLTRTPDQPAEVTPQRVAETAKALYNLPRVPGLAPFAEAVKRLPDALLDRVYGQDRAVKQVTSAIRRAVAGLRNLDRPVGVFMLGGPSGTGKTELAKALAATLYDNEAGLLRFDMSEYFDEHVIARLVGSPPGYRGYEAGGQLTNPMLADPDRVILFDEIEKADPKVLDILLQILDAGRLTDGAGRIADFSRSIIIMTTNLGSREIGEGATSGPAYLHGVDPARQEELVTKSVRGALRPELVNRLSAIVAFAPLNEPVRIRIAERLFARTAAQLSPRGIEIQAAPTLAARLIARSELKSAGRGIERAHAKLIEDGLSEAILEDQLSPGRWLVDLAEVGQLIVTPLADEPPPPADPAPARRRTRKA